MVTNSNSDTFSNIFKTNHATFKRFYTKAVNTYGMHEKQFDDNLWMYMFIRACFFTDWTSF